ncbi:MAG: hypothetical protein Q8L56_05920 [Rhodocyclaceae bacterium]|nr:hypothetical protein [Rhodocyclaceae bacterium]
MALLAESLVEEWLNRAGYFTVRGIRAGVDELDLLAVRPRQDGALEARHVEVQVSTNPVAYISPLTDEQTKTLGKKKTSAWARPDDVLQESVTAWVTKKYFSPTKLKARDRAWPGVHWTFQFVHGKARHPEEIDLIASHGIETIRFYEVLKSLSSNLSGAPKGSAGSDIADMIAYYESLRGER